MPQGSSFTAGQTVIQANNIGLKKARLSHFRRRNDSSRTAEHGRPMMGHILVVDDEPESCRNIADILKKAGYRTSEALSGEEAFMALSAMKKEEYFDLLLIDIQMPGISGIELMDRLKNRDINIPMFAISDVAEKGLITELMRRECADFFYKPFEPDELVKRVGFFLYQ